MLRRTFYIALIVATLISNTPGQKNGTGINNSLNSFAIRLLATTTNEAGNSINIALSPYTVWALMSVIAEGANGNTAKQLETVLSIPSDKNRFRTDFSNMSSNLLRASEGVEFDVSNAIFTTTEQQLIPSFQQVSERYYGIRVHPTNFKNRNLASRMINSEIARATRNRIQNFVTSEDLRDAQIFMTSALYFKGQWSSPFNRSATYRDAFYDEKQNRIGDVDMMYQAGFYPYSRLENIRSYAVELPYGSGDKVSMIVILPFKDENVANVLNMLSKISFSTIVDVLNKAKEDYVDDEVHVYLPKFLVKSDFNLNVVLDKMGIKDIFNEERAELLGIFPHYLYVSRLIQRVEIEVNEEGTVATGAVGAGFTYKSPPPKFQANRPFLYFIVDKPTKSIIFAGKISNPKTLR